MSDNGDNSTYIENNSGVEEEELEPTDHDEELLFTEAATPPPIRVDTRQFNVYILLERIKRDELDISPTFQRKSGLWKPWDQSRLIESLLLRIPIPALFIDATNDERWLVVDGQQRLYTLKSFILDGDLKLTGLDYFVQFNGCSFDELPRNFQRRILEAPLTVFMIEKGTDPGFIFEIFKRINTTGIALSAQEIRHALYLGKVTSLLSHLANSEEFKVATNNSIKSDRMEDLELILRFLAFTIRPYEEYRGDFNEFLNQTMSEINHMSDEEIRNLKNAFFIAMNTAYEVFGKYAFRKLYNISRPARLISKPLFEVWSVNFNRFSDEEIDIIKKRKNIVIEKFIELMNDSRFENSITQATGSSTNIKYRFEMINRLIAQVLK